MAKGPIYAVVDLETTGVDPTVDRIIQFGCVLIENGEIVSHIGTDVNPNRIIPKQIQHLTGISNARVQKAPYFEDIAIMIFNLLTDTIFVAHNVHFDYRFLSHELVRCGLPPLTIDAIDTVELAQIFLPTERSFRLSDLSSSLGLLHNHPHQADSDAQVTAELLLIIEQKMYTLPLITMEKISQLGEQLVRQTGEYIQAIYKKMKEHPVALDETIHIVGGLALRKKEIPTYEYDLYKKQSYPKTKRGKEKLFADSSFTYRTEQAQMMNLVYRHFTEQETSKNLFIEAPTGIGKTFGYLFPLSYLVTNERPLVISTASILLQNQLLQKNIKISNQISPYCLQATIIKSHRHYLDLQSFKETLAHPIKQKQYGLYQMKLLVWLLQTETGDLDELQLTNFNYIFWQEVQHRGIQFLIQKHPLYDEDFVRYLYKKMVQSNVLIVNHAFLIQESMREEPLLPRSPYLIIDEAQHLPEINEFVASYRLNSLSFKKQWLHFRDKEQLFKKLQTILTAHISIKHYLKIYQTALVDLSEEISDFFSELADLTKTKNEKQQEQLISQSLLAQLSIEGEKALQTVQIILKEMLELQTKIQTIIYKHIEEFKRSDRLYFVRLFLLFDQVVLINQCFDLFINHWQARWIKTYTAINDRQGILSVKDLEANHLPATSWYERYERIVYTGGTIMFGKNKNYLSSQLGLPITSTSVKRLPDPYDYEENVRLYIPQEALQIKEQSTNEFAKYIASIINALLNKEDRSILVLFTSLELLTIVYQLLQPIFIEQGNEILAQGISGNREKILRRFMQSKKCVLLGADSFWEGIDLPGDTLQLLIVTRLPFENPNRPSIKAKYTYLEAKGLQPFNEVSLPKAALKLRQALGRLIRSKEDRGALLVLDRRLIAANYSNKILKVFPKKLPIKELPFEDILQDLKEFLG